MAYDYSDGFVENMLTKASQFGLTNLSGREWQWHLNGNINYYLPSGRQGDSHAQMSMYPDTKFDMIFGCNLIDRLHTPDMWVLQSKVKINLNLIFFSNK